MPIVAVFEAPSLTRETYEKSIRMLTSGKERVESPTDWPVPGHPVHSLVTGRVTRLATTMPERGTWRVGCLDVDLAIR